MVRENLGQNAEYFDIAGMTCVGCVAKVKALIEQVPGVLNIVDIGLKSPHATLVMDNNVSIETLKEALKSYKYDIKKHEAVLSTQNEQLKQKKTSVLYLPLILIFVFILLVCLLAQYPFNEFSLNKFMRHFMAGFFIVFSFFKLLDIKGFVKSFRMYDLLAEKWLVWAYLYPFIELGFGISYFINFMPVYTNMFCLLVLGVSSFGVIKSNIDKREIRCACLGSVFNLPMSFVTIIENFTMMLMAGLMLCI